MNNATNGSKPVVINSDFHQRLSPTVVKTVGEGGFVTGDGKLSVVMTSSFFIFCQTEALQLTTPR
jgi:hypothetical protein